MLLLQVMLDKPVNLKVIFFKLKLILLNSINAFHINDINIRRNIDKLAHLIRVMQMHERGAQYLQEMDISADCFCN